MLLLDERLAGFAVGEALAYPFRAPARGLFNTIAAMMAPCSVKANGNARLPPRPIFDIAICDVKARSSSIC
jgi:hypothetical protein